DDSQPDDSQPDDSQPDDSLNIGQRMSIFAPGFAGSAAGVMHKPDPKPHHRTRNQSYRIKMRA
ncbi:MAG: hypothetical protein OSA98_21045, partial [Rubripirellula sp.]|nr:hypothetical protein [Rubripirellula sp.]